MVSAGPLLLLLMCTSLVLCSLSAPPSSGRQDARALQKRSRTTKYLSTLMRYTSKIATAVSPFIGLINVSGPIINAVLGITTTITENTKTDELMALVKVEFQNLNAKIDRYHTEANWKSLTNVYQRYETDIQTAWRQFPAFQRGWDKLSEDGRKKDFELYKNTFGSPCVTSTANLHTALNSKQPSFNSEFGKSLMDFSRCHENIIRGFTVLIAELFFAGNAVSYAVYQQDGANKAEQLTKYAYESASVMFEIHKHCISNFDKHVRLDVKDLIDVTKERKYLAVDIRKFLDAEFDRYNWVAVSFITKHSQHSKLGSLNKHVLSDAFIREEKGEVTVAVAKQLKGNHTKAAQVKDAIKKCFKSEPECKDVIKLLGSCEETVASCKDAKGTLCKVKDTFTAAHAFIDRPHDSSHAVEAKEAPEEYVDPENLPNIPYIYTGNCKKYKIFPGGHFRVLIKSDEELMKKSPCDRLQCEKGKCVLVENTSVPVCECQKGFYGENCEESLERYKDMLSGKKSPKAKKPKKG